MSRFTHEFRKGLFVFRWFVFLAIFLFYVRWSSGEYPFFYFFIGLNAIYTILLSFTLSRKGWVCVIFTDLLLNGFLIAQTGGWYSPFILYAFTTLFWLATYLSRISVILAAAALLLLGSTLPKIVTIDLMLPYSSVIKTHFLLDLTTWICLVFATHFFIRQVRRFYANILQICLFQKKLSACSHVFAMCELTERVLTRVFGTKEVFLCFFHEWEMDPNWRRHHFLQALLDRGEPRGKKPAEIKLADYLGKECAFFQFPLHIKNRCEGAILIQLKEGGTLSLLHTLFMRLLAASVCTHREQLELKRDMEKALHLETRKKLAQDMHDGLAQQLFFLSAQLFKVKQSVEPFLTEQTAATIMQMEQRIKSCHLEVRDYISYLHDQHKSSHIFDAIEQLIKRITAGMEISVTFSTKGTVAQESMPVLDTIYRLVEEATYNVIKHAKAAHLDISMEVSPVQWTIKVKDDGVGFHMGRSQKKSYGVSGMKERVNQAGGSMKIRSRPNDGTEIIAIIPRKAVEMYV